MFGDFELTSGRRSSYYVNIKKAYTDPAILRAIASEMAPHVAGSRVAGMELGAIPIVVAVSLETGKPFSMIRKEQREHGTRNMIEGAIKPGETVDIVEDVSTTGGSILKSVKWVVEAGGRVERAIVVVDRGEGAADALRREGIALISLVNAEALSKGAKK
ncbi:MAG: orotate phosphoribosyltransferase [Thermoplasmata archaeon]|nr:orotate phosphoribosyltransferase [Candidatus Sysuiplasma acidicola]MBX8637674.1 orotate phosphoribosyltransferase [Candidatus Sysuiplasma acidicola]MBX8646336.1 orotate phosphoribosyltransferase [Candidatus Sysuiplasma acidicola]